MCDVSDCSGERGQEHLQQWSFVDQTFGPYGLWRTHLQQGTPVYTVQNEIGHEGRAKKDQGSCQS